MNNFIHEKTMIFTSNGLKSISKIKDNDMIVVADEFGRLKYIEPFIEELDEYGIYYIIKTNIADFYLSANSYMYHNGNLKQKMLVNDIANTLVGCKMSIPAVSHNQHDRIIRKHINDIALYYMAKLKRTHIIKHKHKEWMRIPTTSSKSVTMMNDFIDYHISESNIDWYVTGAYSSSNRKFFIKKVPPDKKVIDFNVVNMLNSFQSRCMIDISLLIDRMKSNKFKTIGKTILIEDFNSHTVPVLAIKAGYRCRLCNSFGFEDGNDSVIISKKRFWDAKVTGAYIAQNEIKDLKLKLPNGYRGVLACSDGHAFILPVESGDYD